jgi:hypothetical protein
VKLVFFINDLGCVVSAARETSSYSLTTMQPKLKIVKCEDIEAIAHDPVRI